MASYAVECPRKVILFGEHSVVHGKLAVAVAIGMPVKLKVHFSPDAEEKFELNVLQKELTWTGAELRNLGRDLAAKFDLNPAVPVKPSPELVTLLFQFISENPEDHRAWNVSRVVMLFLWTHIMYSSGKVGKLKIDFEYDCIWPGLGNSAAYSILGAAALLLAAGYIEPELTEETQKLVCDWAFACEIINHGRPSGIDNTVCCYGGIVRFRKKLKQSSDGKEDSKKSETEVPRLRLVVIYSNQPRSTKLLAEKVIALQSNHRAVFDSIFDAMDALANEASDVLRSLIKEPDDMKHYRALQDLVDVNHGLLQALQVSTPNLDKICSVAKKHDLHGKLTGAGGGGCAFVLLPPGYSEEKLAGFKEDLTVHGFPFCETVVGVPGLMAKRLD